MPPPEAVNVLEAPAQIVFVPDMLAVGLLFMVTVLELLDVHPNPFVTVTE